MPNSGWYENKSTAAVSRPYLVKCDTAHQKSVPSYPWYPWMVQNFDNLLQTEKTANNAVSTSLFYYIKKAFTVCSAKVNSILSNTRGIQPTISPGVF